MSIEYITNNQVVNLPIGTVIKARWIRKNEFVELKKHNENADLDKRWGRTDRVAINEWVWDPGREDKWDQIQIISLPNVWDSAQTGASNIL